MGLMNGLTFGGINSLDYGIYISGEAVFNAPEREVEMLQIPGRNGDFVLDHGRFQNIEVSYPAGTFGDDQTDFREKLSDFRNAILSQVGYQRLTDSYHPDEYRLGVYASGLEVAPVHYNTAGEFVLTFNCKPQRWLTSGEDAVAIADGGTIDNPTLFESEPLLAVEGYGNINFNGYEVQLNNETLGSVIVLDGVSATKIFEGESVVAQINSVLLNTNDTFIVQPIFYVTYITRVQSITIGTLTNCTATTTNFNTLSLIMNDITFTEGTSATATCSAAYTATVIGGSTTSCTASCTVQFDGTDTLTFSMTATNVTNANKSMSVKWSDVYGTSTVSILGNPTYIDCDIGEAYKIVSGEVVSLNHKIELGSDLPKLVSGTNTVNYDNTITSLEVTPRWWKV